MEHSRSIRQQNNIDAALLLLVNIRPLNLYRMAVRCRVLNIDGSAATRLDAMMKHSIRRQRIRSKARAGIVDLKQCDGAAGVILDCRLNVIRVASCEHNETEQKNR